MSNSKKIIGIDASRYPLGKNITGVELYTKKIIDGLLSENLNCKIRLYTRQEINFKNKNVEQVVIKRKRLWTRIGLSNELLRNPVDTLFIPSHTIPNNAPKKTFVIIHGLEASHFPSAYSHFQRFYQRWSTQKAVKHAYKLIAVSQAVKEDLIKFYKCPKEKIEVVYNGFDGKEFTKKISSKKINLVLEEYGINPKNPYILNIGRVEERKNQYRLILAFKKFLQKNPDYTLILAGPLGYKGSTIKRITKRLGLKDKVKFLGFVPHQDIKYLLQGCSIFAFPSLAEGFGFPVLEAFASGCPVITSDYSALKETAENSAILINPFSPEEIHQALETLANDDKLRKKLITAGKKQIEKFSWEKCIKETKKIILS